MSAPSSTFLGAESVKIAQRNRRWVQKKINAQIDRRVKQPKINRINHLIDFQINNRRQF